MTAPTADERVAAGATPNVTTRNGATIHRSIALGSDLVPWCQRNRHPDRWSPTVRAAGWASAPNAVSCKTCKRTSGAA